MKINKEIEQRRDLIKSYRGGINLLKEKGKHVYLNKEEIKYNKNLIDMLEGKINDLRAKWKQNKLNL